MIYVTNGNEVEALVQVSNFEMQQEIKGDFNISLVSHNTDRNPAHRILQEESVITIGDFDFRVKQLKETHRGKQVVAVNTFFDLIDTRKNEIYGGTRTFNEFLTFVLGGTAWRFTFDSDLNDHRLIANFGNNNIIALINALCQVYECEYVILPNNHIHFAKQIGGDYDSQYRYGYNVKALSKNVDTTKLKTYIEGFGANNLWVSYTSPNELKFGKREADPIYDDRFTNGDSLVEHIKSELVDYPEVTFELDSIELLDKELGERVWLIYEPLDIEFQTRVLSQTKQFINGELRTVKVVLGNTLPKTTTDFLISQKVEIDENKKITRSKFEQTNDRITMEVETIGESISKLELTDKEIKLSVDETNKSLAELKLTSEQFQVTINNKVDGMNSQWTQTSSSLQGQINNNGNAISSLRLDINGFETRVNGRIDDTNRNVQQNYSMLQQTDNYIRTEVVKYDEYTGREIATRINQDAYSYSIDAAKIEFNAETIIANGRITGATSIDVISDINLGYKLKFADMTYIAAGNNAMTIEAWNGIDLVGKTTMNGLYIRANYSGHNANASQAGRLYVDDYRYALLYQG